MSGRRHRLNEYFDQHRIGLAGTRADGLLALLGLASGLAAGGVIIGFRELIRLVQQLYMPELPGEAFEWLAPQLRFLLPVGGGVLLALMFWRLPPALHTLGIVHVLERLHYHQGHMPWRYFWVQFVGGVIALASGQSVGREAPSVHLGAASASQLGRQLRLPNNSIRTLVACGVAAAIAASFNTPLAGVVFAMEVVMVEYTIAGFVPVILAAVVATTMTRAMYGDDTAFFVPLLELASLWDLLLIVMMGMALGTLSAAFVAMVRKTARLGSRIAVPWRFILAGVLVGVLAQPVPEIMGLGYDTVGRSLAGQFGVAAMAMIFTAKFIASGVCVAVRVPGGLIGPSVFMGSLFGGCFAEMLTLLGLSDTPVPLFAMLGMAAMMGAVLQAPLAALLALLEMTANPNVILPAMLCVVSASLMARVGFKQESVFTLLLRDAGLDYRHDPLTQGLRRVGVAAVMQRDFESVQRVLALDEVNALLSRGPQWLLIEADVPRPQILPAADLARYHAELAELDELPDETDLLSIPASRVEAGPVHLEASLFEAREIMLKDDLEALYVRRPLGPVSFRIYGLLQRSDIEAGYDFRA